jgi:hypothetical protein
MKSAAQIVAGALFAALATPSAAVTFADAGESATFSFSVVATADDGDPSTGPDRLSETDGTAFGGALILGSLLGAPMAPSMAVGGSEELAAVSSMTPTLAPGAGGLFGVAFETGAANPGATFTIAYDRSQVADPAGAAGLGAQTGLLAFTLGDTLVAAVAPGLLSQRNFAASGLLSVVDNTGFYDSGVGEWSLQGAIGAETSVAFATLTVSLPGPGVDLTLAPVPLPSAGGFLLTALAGLAFLRHRNAPARLRLRSD